MAERFPKKTMLGVENVDGCVNIYCKGYNLMQENLPLLIEFLEKLTAYLKSEMRSTIDSSRQFIILENLQDMGNIGTIIRSCDAFSIDGVILVGDCADVFAPKTVRSAMGSLFRLPIYCCETEEAITLLQKGGFTVYSAELSDRSVKLGEEKLPEKTAVVIGNEGNGVTDTVKNLCDKSLFIPISSAESLNASVAASVIAWELSKSRK